MAKTPMTIDGGKDAWQTYVTNRTKAIPKNSLFGSTLENIDRDEVRKINTDVYEADSQFQRQMKATQFEHKLPTRFQNSDAKTELEEVKIKITKKQDELSERQTAMVDMENRAKYYGSVASPLKQEEQIKKKMLLANPGLDFEITKKMNNIGYAEKNAYNKDKHRQKPPVHKYAVIGDPMEYGMDFSLNLTETHEKYCGHTPISDHSRFYRSLKQHKSAPIVRESGGIPDNIRAMYGSRFVEELFADEKAVEKVKQQMSQEKICRQRKHEKVQLPPVELTTPKNYGDLSHALRQDKFGGYSFLNASLMKDSHTKEVFDRRYKDPDEYRHTWDEYGKWKEKELCREEADREYEEFLQTLPKLAANWDRNAAPTRKEIPQIQKPPKKPKQRKKLAPNPPDKSKQKAPSFEDVVFLTPPKTPEPQIDSIIPVNSVNKRDDDFWEFYDKGLPAVK